MKLMGAMAVGIKPLLATLEDANDSAWDENLWSPRYLDDYLHTYVEPAFFNTRYGVMKDESAIIMDGPGPNCLKIYKYYAALGYKHTATNPLRVGWDFGLDGPTCVVERKST